MGKRVDVDDLIDAHDVAKILGLGHSNSVYGYLRRDPAMPRPVIDRGPNRARLWLKSEVEDWQKSRTHD